MKSVQKIDLGLTGYDELFMNDAERKENKLPRIRHGEKRMKARIGKSSLESLRLVVKTTLSFSWSAMKKSAKS